MKLLLPAIGYLLWMAGAALSASDAYALMKKYKPEQMLDLLIESDIQYRFTSGKQAVPLDLGAKSDTLPPVNIYLKTLSKAGFPIVMEENPTSLLKNMFTAAEKALQKKSYWKAAEIYQAAVKADPNYFKNYTYLGYCCLRLNKTGKAISYLSKAIQINDIDYQAHLYLAEAYEQQKALQKAEASAARAYMLAKHAPEVIAAVKRILTKSQKAIKPDRMLIPGNYSRQGETVAVYLKKEDIDSWSMLLQTLAAWDNEFIFKPHNRPDNLEKYKHALLNHAMHVRGLKRKGKKIAPQAQLLSDLIYEEKMLDPIAYWEIGASRQSQLIQRLPDNIKDDIIKYIRQYVFVPQK